MMRAVCKHTDEKWVLLYIERWLKALTEMQDGTQKHPEKGALQSPLSDMRMMVCHEGTEGDVVLPAAMLHKR